MTTDTRPAPQLRGNGVLMLTASVATATGLLVVLLGAWTSGGDAARAAALGAVLVLAVLVGGTFSVNVVAGLMPALSLAVALMTYLLQIVVLVAALVTASRSELFAEEGLRGWVSGAVVAVTLTWIVAQVVTTARARIPLYDLPETAPEPVAIPTGERVRR